MDHVPPGGGKEAGRRPGPAGLTLRLLSAGDVRLVEERLAFGPRDKHRERLRLQRLGEGFYLIAWRADVPVGHLYLCWGGSPDEPVASRLGGCPDIEDVLVRPDLRSRGIGSRLLLAAEGMAARWGYRRVGLGVRVENVRARRLYERLGYRDAGLGRYENIRFAAGDAGGFGRYGVTCDYLVKDLT